MRDVYERSVLYVTSNINRPDPRRLTRVCLCFGTSSHVTNAQNFPITVLKNGEVLAKFFLKKKVLVFVKKRIG